MTEKIVSEKNNTSSTVTVAGGKLILSLPDAQMPIVWQMDLEKAESTAFTIQEDKKDKHFALISKAQNDEASEIALFDEKQPAVDILMKISAVLQSSSEKCSVSEKEDNSQLKNSCSKRKIRSGDDKTPALIALGLIILLVLIWFFFALGRGEEGSRTASIDSLSSSTAQDSSGVPVSADDFLNNR